LSIDLVARMM